MHVDANIAWVNDACTMNVADQCMQASLGNAIASEAQQCMGHFESVMSRSALRVEACMHVKVHDLRVTRYGSISTCI